MVSQKINILLLAASLGLASFVGKASEHTLHFPAAGVVCDAYFCADNAGVSDKLTIRYLGEKKGRQLVAQGRFDRTAFTFDNGIFCSVRARECRKDRYFDADGKHSATLDQVTTDWLFRR
ncbi:YcgJ family protein [Serratia marcescens]